MEKVGTLCFTSVWFLMCVFVCVFVGDTERERERE